MRISSEALMRKEKKVSRYRACISYTCFYRSLICGPDLKGKCSGSPEFHRNCEDFQHFAGKGWLFLYFFKNQLSWLKSLSCRSESDMLIGHWGGKKEKNGSEPSLQGHTDPAVSGSLLRPRFLIDCLAQQETKDSPGAKEMRAALSRSNKCH